MEKLKTVKISGKDYVTVNSRVKYFNEAYPKGQITTEIIEHKDGVILMKATVFPDIDTPRCFTGWAYEKEGSSFINKTSYIENCETSCVGRALGFLGIGVDVSIASAEEVRAAIEKGAKPQIAEPVPLDEPTQNSPQPAEMPHTATKTPPAEKAPSKPLKSGYMEKTLSSSQRFLNAKKALGDENYYYILSKFGVKSAKEFKTKEKALEALKSLEDVNSTQEAI